MVSGRICSSIWCMLTSFSRSDRSLENSIGTNVSPLYGNEGAVIWWNHGRWYCSCFREKNTSSRSPLWVSAEAWVFKYDHPKSIWEASQSRCSKSCIFWTSYEANVPKGPWDQDHFEELLAKWIITMDQPFYTVEEPEFQELLMYMYHLSPPVKSPQI